MARLKMRFRKLRDKGGMWGCFSGFARKTPPQILPTTAIPRESIKIITNPSLD